MSATGLRKVPLCDDCRDNGGWLHVEGWDHDGKPTVETTRCDHGLGEQIESLSPDEAREISMADLAKDDHLPIALDIIRTAAEKYPTFSANTVRPEMERRGVRPPVRGYAFRRAVAEGVIRRIEHGEVRSSESNTHDKTVNTYASEAFNVVDGNEDVR